MRIHLKLEKEMMKNLKKIDKKKVKEIADRKEAISFNQTFKKK